VGEWRIGRKEGKQCWEGGGIHISALSITRIKMDKGALGEEESRRKPQIASQGCGALEGGGRSLSYRRRRGFGED